MKYGIIGPRDYKGKVYENLEYVSMICSEYVKPGDTVFSGGSKGVEKLVEHWCKDSNIDFVLVPPNIKINKDKAFEHRNFDIINRVEEMLIFWDGFTPSIPDTLNKAMVLEKTTTLVPMRE